jgi:hypothetical protein
MALARRHQRVLAVLAFALLALVVELAGRSVTARIDRALHVEAPISTDRSYYPFLLAGVKVAVALLLARLAWRFVRARSLARAGHRVLAVVGSGPARTTPKVRVTLSPRLWGAFFGATSLVYLAQTEAERIADGRWPLLAPWLHTYALPVFAVLAVLAAVLWSAVSRWLADYETYAAETLARARRLVVRTPPAAPHVASHARLAPRFLFGLAFESRPPPAAPA